MFITLVKHLFAISNIQHIFDPTNNNNMNSLDDYKLTASPEGKQDEQQTHPFNIDAAKQWWNSFDEDRYSDICNLKFS